MVKLTHFEMTLFQLLDSNAKTASALFSMTGGSCENVKRAGISLSHREKGRGSSRSRRTCKKSPHTTIYEEQQESQREFAKLEDEGLERTWMPPNGLLLPLSVDPKVANLSNKIPSSMLTAIHRSSACF